jgi:hypothetical protein
MANYNTLQALVRTWSPHFVLFLDEEQWKSYDGTRYMADKGVIWKRGPRRHPRYSMEVDRVKLGCSKRSKVNSVTP